MILVSGAAPRYNEVWIVPVAGSVFIQEEGSGMFTFVVTCYQQAEVIAMALESVAYQIQRYGQGRRFQLIVTDDCSTDGSRSVIRQWLARNESLFEETDLIFSPENAGICRIYVEALRRVKGDAFLVFNGDDVLAPYNVFESVAKLDEYDIAATAFLRFTGSGDFMTAYRTYLEVVLQQVIRGRVLQGAIRLGCPLMGVALYRKSLVTEEVLAHILRFRTVNDRACLQKIVTGNPGIKVCYINRPLVLYRVSNTSLSHFDSPSRILHNREIALLCRIQRSSEKSPLFRLLLLLQERSTRFRESPNRYVRLLRFFSPYFALMFWLYLRHFRQLHALERELVDRHLRDCQDHYRTIAGRAGAYGVSS